MSNFYIVSGVRRIKGFKRYQGKKSVEQVQGIWRILKMNTHLFGEGIEGRMLDLFREAGTLIERHEMCRDNSA